MSFQSSTAVRTLCTLLAVVVAACAHTSALAGRCATERRGALRGEFQPLTPAPRVRAGREAVVREIVGAETLLTEHFRILWGTGFDDSDPDWSDPFGDGVPGWVSTLADALEHAHRIQAELGFPEPYGGDRTYLDVYVANTGLEIAGSPVVLPARYFAYTDVDAEHGVVYFVFSDDFSAHVADEVSALRATAAHELFHGVQRAEYPWDDEALVPTERWEREGWWIEATATWMEEVCVPEADQYISYVMHFLAHPEEPLAQRDGSHEYGAAIFPGYLWIEHGGPEVWQETFRDALTLGLEEALESALADRGATLRGAVSAFWTVAAHPEDLWPDGPAFYSPFAPAIHHAAEVLPAELPASVYTAPGRFGANLIRLSGPTGKIAVEITGTDGEGAWTVASSSPGMAIPEVLELRGESPVFGPARGEEQYVAVVNVAPEEGRRAFRAVLTAADQPTKEPEDTPGQGGVRSGGCFLEALVP